MVAFVETLRSTEFPVLPLAFRPDEQNDTKSFNAKILRAYAIAKNADNPRDLKLIVGTPASKDGTNAEQRLIHIEDIPIHEVQTFSLKRSRSKDLPAPGVYAKWQTKTFPIGIIIERAIEARYHVFLVGKQQVKKIRAPREYERIPPVRQAQPVPLVTPKGLDLRALSPDVFREKIARLSDTQRKRLTLAYDGETAPQIAHKEAPVSDQSVRYSIKLGLAIIDTPYSTTLLNQRNKYRYQGRLLSEINSEERGRVYQQLRFSEHHVKLLELHTGITTGVPTSFDTIAQEFSLSKKQVAGRLRYIREKFQGTGSL